jgi:hypothetical protein
MGLLDRYEGRSVAAEYLQLSLKSTIGKVKPAFSAEIAWISASSLDQAIELHQSLFNNLCSEVVSTSGVESFDDFAIVIENVNVRDHAFTDIAAIRKSK